MPPFPHLVRLLKHVREVHLNKGGKVILPNDRSKNFVPRKILPIQINNSNTQISNNCITNQITPPNITSQNIQLNITPTEPMFVTVPPRPQRVLHSEAYIKYIEGLQNNTPNISSWEKTMQNTQSSISTVEPPNEVMNWFGNAGKENPDAIINALWHLRNFMLEDTLQIKNKMF